MNRFSFRGMEWYCSHDRRMRPKLRDDCIMEQGCEVASESKIRKQKKKQSAKPLS